MWQNLTILIFAALGMAALAGQAVAEMDHSKMNMEEAPALPMLAVPPASGKAREAGFDGTEVMESTRADAALEVQCAQASRGLIVVDRATWALCTGKPPTPVVPAAKAPEHQGH